jgi:hypothetical protein
VKGRRTRGDDGTVTAFVVCFTIALIAVAGLVVDGGSILAARQHAFEDADAAARAGAQAIDVAALRDGQPVSLNPDRARQLAEAQLAASGERGTVAVNGDQVTVVITRTQPLSILGFVGLSSVTIHASGTARAVRGVNRAGD